MQQRLREVIPATARVKICGLTRPKDAKMAAGLGAWALGVIFAAESPRRVSTKQAARVLAAGSAAAAGELLRVGVFVNPGMEELAEAIESCGLDAVQLHGEETPGFCDRVSEETGLVVIKGLRVSGEHSMAGVAQFDTRYLLLDTYRPGRRGGTGETFEWSLAAALSVETRATRLILAGGLNPQNVAAAVSMVAPYAVDICSGIESSPGVKEPAELKKIFEVLK